MASNALTMGCLTPVKRTRRDTDVANELAGSPSVVYDRPVELVAVPDACAACPLVTVMVCRKCKNSSDVVDYLTSHTRTNVKTVRCQKVCEGPVAGVVVRGRMEWFGKLKGKKQLAALARLVGQSSPAKVPKALRKRRSKERSGCRPR